MKNHGVRNEARCVFISIWKDRAEQSVLCRQIQVPSVRKSHPDFAVWADHLINFVSAIKQK